MIKIKIQTAINKTEVYYIANLSLGQFHAHSFPFRLLLVRKQLQDSLDFAPLAMATPYRKAREAIRLPTSIADTHEEINARFGIMFLQ